MIKTKFNRGMVAQTGQIPTGTRFLQDTFPLEVRDIKDTVLSESINGQPKKILRITGIFQKCDDLNQNGRVYPKSILKEAVDSIKKDLDNRIVMGEYDHPCITTPNFSVLTVDGWKEFRDVNVGDYVYSRVDGKLTPSRVNGIIDKPFSGTVYNFKGRHIDITYTGDHKVIMDTRLDRNHKQVEEKVDEIISDRKKYNKNVIPRVAEWSGDDTNTYTIPGLDPSEFNKNKHKNDITQDLEINSEVFVAFLGLWLAEGSLCSSYGVFINQIKDDYRLEIEEMLCRFPSDLKWKRHKNGYYLSDARLYNYLKPLGDKYTKYIPEDIKQLDSSLLDELVYWFQIGDGRMKHGRNSVFSVSKRLINDLHECYIKAGGCCYEMAIEPKHDYEFAGHVITATKKKVLHQLTLSQTKGIYMDDRFLKITPEQYEGNVYCLVTEHGNFYMQHAGYSFWTGNCDAKIHLERVSHLITKVWMEGKYVYGEAEVIEGTDCGRNLAALLRAGVKVGISSRGVGDMECVNEGLDDEHYVVQDGYRFVTWDVVGEPSVQEATLSMMEGKNKLMTRAKMKQDPSQELIKELEKYLK